MSEPTKAFEIPNLRTAPAAPGDAERRELAQLTPAELVARYRWGVENFDRRMLQLDTEQLTTAFLPDAGVGNWPVLSVLGHLADNEIADTHRIRRMLAEDGPELNGWDENAFIDSPLYAGDRPTRGGTPLGGCVAVIYTLRMFNSDLLSSLDEQQWSRRGLHAEHGPITVRSLVETNTWHLERHTWFVNQKIQRLIGDEPCAAPGSQSCGPSCGCHPE